MTVEPLCVVTSHLNSDLIQAIKASAEILLLHIRYTGIVLIDDWTHLESIMYALWAIFYDLFLLYEMIIKGIMIHLSAVN